MKVRTWHVESAVAALVILITTLASPPAWSLAIRLLADGQRSAIAALAPWLLAIAKWLSFGAMSIGNRVAERAEQRARWATAAGVPENAHEVYCARLLVWHVVGAQLITGIAQAAAGAWDGLAVGLLFALYVPLWRRRIWRRLHPLQDVPGEP
jgi:hypothetical protein